MRQIPWVRRQIRTEITRSAIVFVVIVATLAWAIYWGPTWKP